MPINLTFSRSARAVAGLAIATALFATAVAAAPKPDIGHFTLANGLEVVVVPDRRAPVVTHMVWYKVGAADETPGKSGLAHFLEHLMFKGTAKNPMGEFSKTVAFVGGQENAFTTQDYTGYFQRVSREHLKTLMEFESDRMTGLVLTDAAVAPELKVVLEEQNQRVANNPRARLSEQIDAALYLNHPYGRPVIGWRHEIEKLNREDALAFYKRFYTPNNAVLVVAGDVTHRRDQDAGRSDLRQGSPRSPRSARASGRRSRRRSRPATSRWPTRRSSSRACIAPISCRRRRPPSPASPRRSKCCRSFSATAPPAGSIARSWSSARLAVGAGGWYNGTALDATQFGVYGSPKPGVTLPKLEDAIDAVIDDVVAKGVTADEVERAKNRLIADAIYAQDSQSTMARWYGAALTTGSTVEAVQTWPDRIRAVTADAVNAAAKAWLDKRRSVTGYLIKDSQREEKRS